MGLQTTAEKQAVTVQTWRGVADFKTREAATGKARSPFVDSRVRRTTRDGDEAERRRRRASNMITFKSVEKVHEGHRVTGPKTLEMWSRRARLTWGPDCNCSDGKSVSVIELSRYLPAGQAVRCTSTACVWTLDIADPQTDGVMTERVCESGSRAVCLRLKGNRVHSFNHVPVRDPRKRFLTAVTLTLTRWPWYTNLTWRFRRRTCLPKINFLGQCFQKLEHYERTDRQTDRCDWTHNDSALAGLDTRDKRPLQFIE